MKKFAICLLTVLSLTTLPMQVKADVPKVPTEPTETTAPKPESSEVKALELRLNEIKAMDKSKLKTSEKKNLRKEVKSINRRLHDLNGGFYVSAGALIIIVVLLIVLL
jgi:hypothetical protein